MKVKNRVKIILLIIVIIAILNWGTFSDLIKTNKDNIENLTKDILPSEMPTDIGATTIFFCPTDDCLGEMITWIDTAEEYIHCALFELELQELKDKFVEIEKNGNVDIKIITDDNYLDEVDDIIDILDIKDDDRSALMHNKFCIIDGKSVWTGSFNPTFRGANKNNNNVIVVQSENFATVYEQEFQEMWNGQFGKGNLAENNIMKINDKEYEVYFCPEDWCANKLIYALQDAETEIKFMTFSFTHDGVGETLIERSQLGVNIQGIFEKSQNNKYTEYEKLLGLDGIDVRWDGNPANMHNKVFIIDASVVVTGSFNPSNNGDKRNDENLVIIHNPEIAAVYLDEFDRIWGESK